MPSLFSRFRTAAVLLSILMLGACVYRVDVQQGNLLEYSDIEAVQPGMTRSQVRFLLGTPVVEDAFESLYQRFATVLSLRLVPLGPGRRSAIAPKE